MNILLCKGPEMNKVWPDELIIMSNLIHWRENFLFHAMDWQSDMPCFVSWLWNKWFNDEEFNNLLLSLLPLRGLTSFQIFFYLHHSFPNLNKENSTRYSWRACKICRYGGLHVNSIWLTEQWHSTLYFTKKIPAISMISKQY